MPHRWPLKQTGIYGMTTRATASQSGPRDGVNGNQELRVALTRYALNHKIGCSGIAADYTIDVLAHVSCKRVCPKLAIHERRNPILARQTKLNRPPSAVKPC